MKQALAVVMALYALLSCTSQTLPTHAAQIRDQEGCIPIGSLDLLSEEQEIRAVEHSVTARLTTNNTLFAQATHVDFAACFESILQPADMQNLTTHAKKNPEGKPWIDVYAAPLKITSEQTGVLNMTLCIHRSVGPAQDMDFVLVPRRAGTEQLEWSSATVLAPVSKIDAHCRQAMLDTLKFPEAFVLFLTYYH